MAGAVGVWRWNNRSHSNLFAQAQPATAPAQVGLPAAAPMGVPSANVAPASSPAPRLVGPASSRPQATSAVEDRWPDAETLNSASNRVPTSPDHSHRVRIVRADFKYPLLRLEETVHTDPQSGTETLVAQTAMVADHVLVKISSGVDARVLAGVVSANGGAIRSIKPASKLYLVTFSNPLDLDGLPAAIEALKSETGVVALAEPDYIAHAIATPNDPSFTQLYGLHNTGQTGGVADADINAPEAWAITTGSRTVRVGVIDTGIDHTHPDLAANMWTNPGEIAGNNIDDDGNGYVDDVRGWDFVNDDNNPMDDNRHGTHVAGTIGGVGGNSLGVVGVNWQVSLVGLKFLSGSGSGTHSDAVEAVAYATTLGLELTSNSWGGGGYSQALYDAIADANTAGRLFIAAAGNSSRNTDTSPNYPSGYNLPNIIAVAATDHADQLAYFSNYGASTVDLAAPGVNTLSTTPGGTYQSLSGTSMATPHVAGAAALLWAHRPSLTATDIKSALLVSVDTKAHLLTKTVSGGRLNVHSALLSLENLLVSPNSGWSVSVPSEGPIPSTGAAYTLRNLSDSALAWTATVDVPWAQLTVASGVVQPNGTATTTVSLNAAAVQNLPTGTHSGKLRITDVASGLIHVRPLSLNITPPAVFTFDLSSDPGWTRTGQWAFGKPSGLGGGAYGNPDPASGYTGNNVLGVNLMGNYSTTPGGPHTLTAGPFNFTGYAATRLQFRRWLNSDYEPYVSAKVELSTNGTTWQTLWANGSTFVTESAWSLQDIDLAAYADNKPSVSIRWSYTINGGAWPLSGWNIDDIVILGAPPQTLRFDAVGPLNEGAGSSSATLNIKPAPAEPLTIQFTSGTPATVASPASIIVPAGVSSVVVPLSILDNTALDGTRTVLISPSAPGYSAAPLSLTIHDNETATLTLELPAVATEGSTAVGRVSVDTAPTGPITVTLTSDLADAATVPPTVTIPTGATSADFTLSFPDNTRIENSRDATIDASVTGWIGAQETVSVADNDLRALSLSLVGVLAEGRGTVTDGGTLALSGTLTTPLTVTLVSSAPDQLSVAASVVVPAGATSVKFPISLPDDANLDGAQTVTLTASEATFASGETTASVADNDPASFAFDTIPSPQYVNQAFSARIVALDINGAPALGFTGAANLSGTIDATPSSLQPSQTNAFVAGEWTGAITTLAAGENWTLQATYGSVSGASNAFTVRVPVVQIVNLANNDIVYDAGTNRLYASTPSGTIVPIDPATGALDPAITIATTPATLLARATDGSRLWVAHDANAQIIPVSLPDLTVGASFNLGTGSYGQTRAEDIVALPGSPDSLAVARYRSGVSPRHDGVSVYVNGSRLTSSTPNHTGSNSIEPGSAPGRIFGYNNESTEFGSRRLQVSETGITNLDVRSEIATGFGITIHASDDIVAASSGRIYDGESYRILASLPYSGLVRPDATAKRIYLLSDQGGGVRRLRSYDTDRFAEIGSINVSGVSGTPGTLVRWGEAGLAFRTPTQIFILNTVVVPTADSANLQVTQLATPTSPVVGAPINYLVSVRNLGGGDAVSVVLTDTLPAGSTLVEAVASQGSVDSSVSGQVSANIGTIAAGEEATLRLRLSLASPGTVTHTAIATATTGDPDTSNNQSVSTLTASAPGTLSLRRLSIGARDIAYDNITDRLMVTTSNTASTPNSLLRIDPVTLAPYSADYLGDNPGRLKLTNDGQYAYAILNGTFGLARAPIVAGTSPFLNFPVGHTGSTYGLMQAYDIVPVNGRPEALAVARDQASGTVAIYENGIQLSTSTAYYNATSVLVDSPTAQRIYGYNSNNTGFDFYQLNVLANGVSTGATKQDLIESFSVNRLKRAGNLIYTNNGRIIDPEALTLVANLAISGPVEPSFDDDVFYILEGSTLRAYDLVTRQPLGTLALGTLDGTPTNLVRCGGRHLAFTTSTGQLYVLDAPSVVPPPPLRVVLPARLTEGVGTVPGVGQVEILRPSDTDISFQLTTSAPDVLDVTRNLIIPAGQTSVTFDVTVTDNAGLNGTRSVVITPATTATYTPKPATVEVDDDETGTLSLSLPDILLEGSGVIGDIATLTLSAAPIAPVSIALSSSDTTEVQVPATVILPAGETSVTFAVTLPDDDLLDGPQAATITAAVPGYTAAVIEAQVLDNEGTTITLTLPVSATEGSYVYANVTLPGKAVSPVTVTLSSSDTTELGNATGTIPAGQSSGSFYVGGVNDTLTDGAQTVTLTASSPGFTSGSATISITDNDAATASWSTIIGSQTAGTAFNATLTFKTIDGQTATGYNGNVPVTALNADGAATLKNAPINVYVSGGVSTASYTVLTAGTDTRLRAQPVNFAAVDSNLFKVNPGPVAALQVGTIPATQITAQPTTLALTAQDAYGNTVTSFTGSASLSIGGAFRQAGSGTQSSKYPLHPYHDEDRTQIIYLASELGGAAKLTGVALKVTAPLNVALNNWTIRIKPTAAASYATSASWQGSGWTIVHQGTPLPSSPGWIEFPFATPYDYNGTDNLLVDFSIKNSGHPSTYGMVEATTSADYRVMHGYADGAYGDPLNWNGASPSYELSTVRPNLRFRTQPVGGVVTPGNTGAFTAGAWTGPVTFLQPGVGVSILATSGVIAGNSNTLDIQLAAPVLAPEPAITGGTANTLAWTPPSFITGTATTQVQASPEDTFAAPVTSPWLDATTHTVSPLTETTWHYRARTRLTVPFTDTWEQTSLADFSTGTLSQTSVQTSPGNVVLALNGSTYFTTGSITSPLIQPANRQSWGKLAYDISTPNGTTLTIDVLDGIGNLLAADVSSDIDLNQLPGVSGQINLKLRANLQTTSPFLTPSLRAWTLGWITPQSPAIYDSAWSTILTSLQDATAPALAVTSSANTTTAAYTLTGTAADANGIVSVSINGLTATTADGYVTWNQAVTLHPGANEFSLVASDPAAPANTITTPFTVTYTPPDVDTDGMPDAWEVAHGLDPESPASINGSLGDPDKDGLPNLLEYAFNLNPSQPDATPPYSTQTVEDPDSGHLALGFTYRRLIHPGTLTYSLLISSNLTTWTAPVPTPEELSVTPNPDGLTETVVVRIPLSSEPAFVRLQIANP